MHFHKAFGYGLVFFHHVICLNLTEYFSVFTRLRP